MCTQLITTFKHYDKSVTVIQKQLIKGHHLDLTIRINRKHINIEFDEHHYQSNQHQISSVMTPYEKRNG